MPRRFLWGCVISLLLCASAWAQRGQFMTVEEFAQQAMGDSPIQWQVLWLQPEQREQVERILDRRFPAFRVRYLQRDHQTAWILEEIGKEMPITFGFVVNDGAITDSVILEYRESRGGEIRHAFFTQQFDGAALKLEADGWSLTNPIDGITGATLSVRAMKKVAAVALYLHQLTCATAGTQ